MQKTPPLIMKRFSSFISLNRSFSHLKQRTNSSDRTTMLVTMCF